MDIIKNTQSNFIEFYPHENGEWLYVRWIGLLDLKSVQEGCCAVLHELEKFQMTKLLNDNRDLIGHWSFALDWIEEVWLPLAMEVGLVKFAHILSHYSYGQLSARQLQTRIGKNLQMKLFQSVSEAEDWLLAG